MSPLLLVLIFVVELVILLVNAIGAATINNLLWNFLNQFPIDSSKLAAENRKLQKEFLKARRDLNATSSQDEFAKWAKMKRHHDKLLEQLDKTKKDLATQRTKFDRYINGARLILTRAPQYIIPFWYSKEPMFWLPHGLFPYYAEWFLSLPKAPLGSVSIMSWQVACTATLSLLFELLASIWGLVAKSKTQAEAQTKVPGRTGAGPKEKMSTPASSSASEKEL